MFETAGHLSGKVLVPCREVAVWSNKSVLELNQSPIKWGYNLLMAHFEEQTVLDNNQERPYISKSYKTLITFDHHFIFPTLENRRLNKIK